MPGGRIAAPATRGPAQAPRPAGDVPAPVRLVPEYDNLIATRADARFVAQRVADPTLADGVTDEDDEVTFAEISRSLRALSSTYVERRHKLREGAALAGAGKRAAFALFYGPLHFLLIREIVRALPAAAAGARTRRVPAWVCQTGVGALMIARASA